MCGSGPRYEDERHMLKLTHEFYGISNLQAHFNTDAIATPLKNCGKVRMRIHAYCGSDNIFLAEHIRKENRN